MARHAARVARSLAAAPRADAFAAQLAMARTAAAGKSKVFPVTEQRAIAAAAIAAASDVDNSAPGMARRVKESMQYQRAVAIAVLAHTLAIAVDGGDPPYGLGEVIVGVYIGANTFFTIDFVLGYVAAVRRFEHVMQPDVAAEAILVICGLVGLWKASTGLSAVPAARILRLAARNPGLAALMRRALAGGRALAQLALVLGLFCAAAATAGMYVVGTEQLEGSRADFKTAGVAVLTSFQLVTGDNWR